MKYQNWFSEQYRILMSLNKDIKVSGIVPFLKLMTLRKHAICHTRFPQPNP